MAKRKKKKPGAVPVQDEPNKKNKKASKKSTQEQAATNGLGKKKNKKNKNKKAGTTAAGTGDAKAVVHATKPRTRAPVVVVDSVPVINGVLEDYSRITGEEEAAAMESEGEEEELGFYARKKKRKSDGLKAFQHEVEDLGATAFTGREKRDWDKKKLVQMGGVIKANERMPRTMLMGMRAKQRKREDWNRELMRNMGLAVKKREKIIQASDTNGGMHTLNATVGTFNKGVLSLKRKHIKSVHQNASRRAKPIHKLMKR